MKLINWDPSYVYYTSFYKRPIVRGGPTPEEVESQKKYWEEEEKTTKFLLRHDLARDGLLDGLETEEEIEKKVEEYMPAKHPDWVFELHWDNIRRDLNLHERIKRHTARSLWEGRKGYYDRVPKKVAEKKK